MILLRHGQTALSVDRRYSGRGNPELTETGRRLWAAAAQRNLGEERATAIYLDGFSPTRNPEVWTPEFVGRLAKTLAPGGVLATYSAAGHVRRALEAAGLRVERRPGAPGKRECLRAMKVSGE